MDIFVKAQVKLHHTLGNPHHKPTMVLDNLWQIRMSRVKPETVSYWWCVEDLQKNYDPKGAQLNQDTMFRERLWAHPTLIQLEKEERAQMEYEEYEESVV